MLVETTVVAGPTFPAKLATLPALQYTPVPQNQSAAGSFLSMFYYELNDHDDQLLLARNQYDSCQLIRAWYDRCDSSAMVLL